MQPATAPSLRERITASLEILAARPWLLVLLALTLNAIVQPYLGLIHDSRLYALLANNRASGGAQSHDLFLAYGSQDSYSFFSLWTVPLVARLGVPAAFFLIYLISRVILVYGMVRLVLRLFGATPLASLSVLILAIDPLAMGGFGIFQVNEAFLTPRLPAHGLTLLGLTWLLDRRWLAATLCFVLGCALHPLIAFVGFPLLVGWAILLALPRRGWPLLVGLAVLGGLLLAIPPLNVRLFGDVDADWLEQIRIANPFHFPALWSALDWRRIVLVLAIVLAAAWQARTGAPERSSFLALTALVGAVGLLATTVASEAGYRLLFQAQPYRWLWVVHVLAIPGLVHLLAWAWSTTNEPRRVVLVLAAALLVASSASWGEWVLPALLLPIFVLSFRGRQAQPGRPDWLSSSLAASVAVGLIVGSVTRLAAMLSILPAAAPYYDAIELLYLVLMALGVPVFLVLLLGLLARLAGPLGQHHRRVAGALLAVFLLLHVGSFIVSQTPWYREQLKPKGASTVFVAGVLADRHREGKLPTVYWPGGRLEQIWIELPGCAYFDLLQVSGLIFSRDTARESFRRGAQVGLFEMERLHHGIPSVDAVWDSRFRKLYQVPLSEARPTAVDVRRLAQDPCLDYIVLDGAVDLPALATNGHVSIYACETLRGTVSSGDPR
jgi:hypothetical protein